MPPKRKDYELATPEWIDHLKDDCLREIVLEALVARLSADRGGAMLHEPCCAAMRSADTTMDAVRFGRVKGREAHKKASVAVRKYTVAAECAHPTASRYSRKRKRP